MFLIRLSLYQILSDSTFIIGPTIHRISCRSMPDFILAIHSAIRMMLPHKGLLLSVYAPWTKGFHHACHS